MTYHTLEQTLACDRIEYEIDQWRIRLLKLENEISSLTENIETQEWLIRDKQRQIDRTGDPESFMPDIRGLERVISNLERQLNIARNNKQEAESDLREVIANWKNNGCDNPVKPSEDI